MATATTTSPAAHAGEIKFQYGRPEVFALKFLEPKVFDGQFGPRGMFTACDEGYGERKIWLDHEDARNIVDELRRLGVNVGDPLRVTKIKHPRGGGHGFLVERAAKPAGDNAPDWVRDRSDAGSDEGKDAPPSRIEAQLAQSIQLVRTHGTQVFQRPPAADAPATAPAPPALPGNQSMTQLIAGALIAAIDAYALAADYARAKNLPVSIDLAFNAEDIRASATASLIEYWRSGGTRG